MVPENKQNRRYKQINFIDLQNNCHPSKHTVGNVHKASTEGGLGGSTPPPKFRSFDKAEPNSQVCVKYIRNNLMGIQILPICKLSGTLD
jgi:hypothetical protein